MDKVAKDSKSFVMNMFRGSAVVDQVFPFPEVMNEEQRETLESLVDPVEKWFYDNVDAAKNDAAECIDEPQMQGLREMGSFGLQVCLLLTGIGEGSWSDGMIEWSSESRNEWTGCNNWLNGRRGKCVTRGKL